MRYSLKVCILFSLAFIESPEIKAQSEVTSIDLVTGTVANLKAFSSNDTTVISFKEQNYPTRLIEILPDGSRFEIPPDAFFNDDFCGYESNGNDEYFYRLVNGKGQSTNLEALHIDNTTRKKETLEKKITFQWPVIGVIKQNNKMIVLTRDIKKNLIELFTLKEYAIVKREVLEIPDDLSQKKAADFEVIQPAINGWIHQTSSLVKIYFMENNFIISFDRAYSRATTIYFFNQLNKLKREVSIDAKLGESFRSFVVDSLLFRLSATTRRFTISAYELPSGKLIDQKQIRADSMQRDRLVYTYSGKKGTLTKQETLLQTIQGSSPTHASILAQKVGKDNYSLSWGTILSEGVGTLASPNPLMVMVGSTILTAIRQATVPLVSHYAYSTFTNGKLNMQERYDIIFRQLDEYLITLDGKNLIYRGCLTKDIHNAIGFFEDQKSKKLIALKFHN